MRRESGKPDRAQEGRPFILATLALPAIALPWTAVEYGGNRAGTAGLLLLVVGTLLAARIVRAPGTVERPGRVMTLALLALTSFAAWTLASLFWAHAPDRVISDFCRTALYILTLASYATLPRWTMMWVLRSVALGLGLIAIPALLRRLLPGLLGVGPAAGDGRLSWPIGYWNAMALLLAIAIIVAVHLAADRRERRAIRVVAATLLPMLVPALYLTQSRAGLAVAVLGAAIYAVVARSRGLLAVALAVGPPTLLALTATAAATALIEPGWRESGAAGQRLTVLALLACCALAAGWLLARVEPRAVTVRLPLLPRRVVLAAAVAAILVGGAAGIAAGGTEAVADRFRAGPPSENREDPRDRLTQLSNNGRLALWRAALQGAEGRPLTGTGAGTFVYSWDRWRPELSDNVDAHSLYIETYSELGLPGLILLAAALAALLTAALSRAAGRAPARAVATALLAAWVVHAAVEWMWEIPAVTLPVLIVVATAARREGRISLSRRWCVAAVAAIAVGLVPGTLEAVAQASMDDAVPAYNGGRCNDAVAAARIARAVAPWQADPLVVQGLCEARAGRRAAALASLAEARRREPRDWKHLYDTGLVDGATGGDALPWMNRALRRNPRDYEIVAIHRAASPLLGYRRDQLPATLAAYVRGLPEGVLDLEAARPLCPGKGRGYWRWSRWSERTCEPSTKGG